MKVKVFNKDDIVVLVVPHSIKFSQLKDKVFKKVCVLVVLVVLVVVVVVVVAWFMVIHFLLQLSCAPKLLQFKDEDEDMVTLNGDDDLMIALEAHPQKLSLYVL